jgi:hypothetical protein
MIQWLKNRRWGPTYLRVAGNAIDDEIMRKIFNCGGSLRDTSVTMGDIKYDIVMCGRRQVRKKVESMLDNHGIAYEETEHVQRPVMSELEYEIVISAMQKLNNGLRWSPDRWDIMRGE